LYFSPINSFAAQFLGEYNRLTGTVEANGNLRIATGYCLAMPASQKVTPGEKCEVMLRPERIRIAGADQRDASTTTATAAGKVVSVSFIGSMTTLAVQLPDGTVLKLKSTSLPSQSRYKIGDAIALQWEPGDLVVLQNEK
jgi:putative spermidine/putrescine transport system ATP-binding protein